MEQKDQKIAITYESADGNLSDLEAGPEEVIEMLMGCQFSMATADGGVIHMPMSALISTVGALVCSALSEGAVHIGSQEELDGLIAMIEGNESGVTH